MRLVTAADMARERHVDPKYFRQALRSAGISWHQHAAAWTVEAGTEQHRQMLDILDGLTAGTLRTLKRKPAATARKVRSAESDEAYIIDLCDEIIGVAAARQYRFEFLRGDPGENGVGRMLPVDAWYEHLKLVIEYRESQHSEVIPFFDRRSTISGVGRGIQRALYDQRRREVLPKHGIALVELDYRQFAIDGRKRLNRCIEDRATILEMLDPFL